MGLDIQSNDNLKTFHIGYIGFGEMRALFVLHYGKELYEDYKTVLRATINWSIEANKLFDDLLEKIDDLSILIDHSDCDGELSSNECKKLQKCLFVDEEKIRSLSVENDEYYERMINRMYEFIDLINYCAKREDIKLIFG